MGKYLNPSGDNFKISLNSEIYVDKSGLIGFTNSRINTQQRYICVSRPRRFGKSVTAYMLAAYYGKEYDSEPLFSDLEAAGMDSFSSHLNAHNVIFLNIQRFMSRDNSISGLVEKIESEVLKELQRTFGECVNTDDRRLVSALENLYALSGERFIFIIDEWDCVFREKKSDTWIQEEYLDFLRDLLKDQSYVELAYMTGILPIKKYGTHSALNMFYEYTMLNSYPITPYFGFTEEEVRTLCRKYGMDFDEVMEWYDGYRFCGLNDGEKSICSVYSPKSVVDSMLNRCCDSYWTQTETYEALKEYIQRNLEGLKDAVVEMLGGNSVEVNPRYFQNDMTTFKGRDDILTLLVHLGYLTYNSTEQTVSIPNKEVAKEFVATIENIDSYSEVTAMLRESRNLLHALWSGDEEAVASGVELAHQNFPAIHYNNENALSCVLELAFYYAREYYTILRELPAGKGFADICLLPRPNYADKPAVIIELKWNKSAETAINQIKRNDYPDALKAYHGDLLLCGISYDKEFKTDSKKHHCKIEWYVNVDL
ncbi:MAG: AAA family ATPase [Clostridiales bacterium]|nr:AAA family ATPase [Clostridiales bacterium]